MAKKEVKAKKIDVKHKEISKKNKFIAKIVLGCTILIMALLLLLFIYQIGVHKVKVGDTVTLDYTGYFEDGKVFDTSVESIGLENKLDKKLYEPLAFKVGAGQVVPGFDEAVVGLSKGERKRFEIKPDKAYGEVQEDLILRDMKRDMLIRKYSNVTKSAFDSLFGKKAVINDILTVEEVPWKLKVSKIIDDQVFVENLLKLGDKISLPGTSWDADVKEIYNDVITLRQNPVIGKYVSFPTSKGMVMGTVINVKDLTYDIDTNHPLAGKNLIFEITIRDVTKN